MRGLHEVLAGAPGPTHRLAELADAPGARALRAPCVRTPPALHQSPAGDLEDLTAIWLWSERQGVFSHPTALVLHELSDVLPAQVHLTLPEAWRKQRLRVRDGVLLHHREVAESE